MELLSKSVKYIDGDIIGQDVSQSDMFRMPDQPQKIIAKKEAEKDKHISDIRTQIESLRAINSKEDQRQIKKLENEIRSLTKRYVEQRKNIEAAVEADKLRFFCPNGAQERVIHSTVAGLRNSKIPVVLITCGNGVGKTTISVQTLANIVFGPQNGWFDYDVFRNWEFPKLCWYVSRPDAIADTVTPMIEELWSANYVRSRKYETFKDGKKFISRIETNTGWTIVFKTFNQDPGEFESAQVGIIVLDEPAPEAIWKAVKSRRRKGCLTMLPMTPLYTPPYIVDEVKKAITAKKNGYYWIKASVHEASMKTGVRGHLDHETMEAMIQSYDPDEIEARVHGEIMYFSGRIYPEFSRELHVVEPHEYPVNNRCNFIQVVDPHDSRPCACIYLAVTPAGMIGKNSRIIIFDETPNDEFSEQKGLEFWEYKKTIPLEDEVKNWTQIEEKHRFNRDLIFRVMDKRFGWQKRGRRTFNQLFSDFGFYFSKSYDSPSDESELMYGHRKVKQMLAKDEEGMPRLVVYSHCRHTISGLEHYIRRRKVGRAGEDQAEADGQIVEKHKDFPDIVRYGVVAAITPIEKRGKSEVDILLDKIERDNYLKQKQGFTYDDY